ncbi:MAG: hypothetical protein JSW50_13140 [Candidatus Latescibacterota bacterium]|nr:MAG: hypothetical protein JSW50_13140 [Candidatus Latescibacterota bacterium]
MFIRRLLLRYFVVTLGLTLALGCMDEAPLDQPTAPSEKGSQVSNHDYGTACVKCHPEYAPIDIDTRAPRRPIIAGQLTHEDLLCIACHEPHGATSNLKIIREQIETPHSGAKNVRFTEYNGSQSMADGNSTYDGLCEVCHTTTNYHRNDGTGDHTHNAGGRCTGCHLHNAGFQPVLGECSTCHDTTQPLGTGDYRRQVVGTGGDFERTSHHVNDGLGGESVTSLDCVICHNNSKHQSLTDPQVRLFNMDTGYTVTYDGTASSMETFCVNCHDTDGGYQFSDGNTPPDIETAWLASSHKAGGMTCYGDGVSTGCHDNGHGSDKVSLKAPFTGATPDEEAFCYSCHDSDGPAASDVQDDFSGTLTGTTGSGAVLNTHHDISDADQAYSGAVVECDDCHDPHSATPTQKVIGNVDPSDGRDPAPGNSFAGSSYVTEFCFECHDNSYPASVTPPTTALIDIYTQWVDTKRGDQHGGTDASSNPNLRPGSGYAPGEILRCEACHEPGHGNSTNLFQLRTTIYSKDGSTALVSDSGDTLVYVTTDDVNNTDLLINGQNWCSTCHPQPMGGNKSKGCIDCHYHTDRF